MKKKGIVGWIILSVCSVAAIVFIAVVVMNFMSRKNEEYRTIKIAEHNGEIVLARDEQKIQLDKDNSFSGMNLKSEDSVTTQDEAHMVLLVDSDKHIYADENTCFSIVAADETESGNIKINLEYGAALFEIDNKLPEGTAFEVETPNATAAVRGTTFGVYYDAEKNETKVEVSKGAVEVKSASGTKQIEVGEAVLVTGDDGNISPEMDLEEFDNIISLMESLLTAQIPADDSVEGDRLLDDTTKREYIVVYSAAAMMFGNGDGIFIFESGNGASQKEMAMISQELSDNFNDIYGSININGNSTKIMYQQIPDFAMDIITDFCMGSDNYIRSLTIDAMGMGDTQSEGEISSVIDEIMKFVFDFKVVESTPYDFYDGLGIIE